MTAEKRLKYLSEYMEQYVHNLVKKALGQMLNKREKVAEEGFQSWLAMRLNELAEVSRKRILEHQSTFCIYCRTQFTDHNKHRLTQDHIIPLSKGGLNVVANRRVCCYTCNQWKGDKYLEDWLKEVQAQFKKNRGFRKVPPQRMAVMIGNIRALVKQIQPIKHKISIYKTTL